MGTTLLFDFDGTIADSLESFIGILGSISEKYKLPSLSRKEIEALRAEDPRAIIKKLNIPLYKIPFIAREMKKLQQQQIADIKPFVGLPEVLHKLKDNGCTLGILTSNGRSNVELFLKKNNLEIFQHIYSDSSIFGKAAMIHKFLKQHPMAKKDIIYVGDEIRDIQACHKVGIPIISVTWGFNTKAGLAAYGPSYIVNTPDELEQVVMNL